MAKRRVLRGKKLLVAAGIAATSIVGCNDVVANLVAPPDSGDELDANMPEDASTMMPDAVVANLVAPPDSGTDAGGMDSGTEADSGTDAGSSTDAGSDGGATDADMPDDSAVIGFPDAPVANLLPPPDGSAF